MNTTEYTGFFAEFYDLLQSNNIDYKIYSKILKEYGVDILELGCGTGRIAIPLAENGYNITGIELEKDMINILKSKKYPQDKLKVIQGDARSFNLNEMFDCILLSCNFINNFVDSNDIILILNNCKKHLRKNGIIIIDCSIPNIPYMKESNGIESVLEFITSRKTLIKDYFCARYDFINQIEIDEIRLEEYDDDTLLRVDNVKETLTYYMPREIRSLARECNLKIVKESGSILKDIPICEESEEMIFYLSKQ